MRIQFASALAGLLLAAVLPVAAQRVGRPVVPRTPDGRPDLQGNWSNATLTPIERPQGLGPVLTEQQVEAMEGRRRSRIDSLSQKSDPNRPAPPVGGVSLGDPRFDAASGGTGGYNVFFIDGGDRVAVVHGEARSSLITRPATGRVPALTPRGRERQAALRSRRQGMGEYDHPENRPLAERCILSFGSNAGPPMLPNYFYNNNYTIVQTRDHVMIMTEMVHDARIIRLGNGPRLPAHVTPYMGDSWGRWDGDTLVIETVNLHPVQAANFYGASPAVRITERLSLIDDRTILYRFTVDDPDSFTESWGGELPFRKMDDLLYEYACHEGNYALANVLSGARDEERRKARAPEEEP